MNEFIQIAASFAPLIIGFVIYTELMQAGYKVYDSNGKNQIGTEIYIFSRPVMIRNY